MNRALDPQDVGVGVFAAQASYAGAARGLTTWDLSACVRGVWSPSGPQIWAPGWRLAVAPTLLCCLAADAEAACDLSPGEPGSVQTDHGLADGLVQLGSEPGHVGQGVNITGCDSPGVGADDAPDEGGVLVALGPPPSPLRCQPSLDTRSPAPFACACCVVCHERATACSFRLGHQRGSRPGAFTR